MFEETSPQLLVLQIIRTIGLLVGAFLVFEILQGIVLGIYNVFFHPLRHFPGNQWEIIFPVLRYWQVIRGTASQSAKKRHDKYGDVVRIAGNVLSYSNAQAWKDIYGSSNDLPKVVFGGVGLSTDSVFLAGRGNHGRQRRVMAPAFTEKSIARQEQLIRVYVDMLVQRLRETRGQPTNAVKWFNLTTFDLIGDLAFGQSLQGLESGASNMWLDNMTKQLQFIPILVLTRLSRIISVLIGFTLGRAIKSVHAKQAVYIKEMVQERLTKDDRGDFMDHLIGKLPEKELIGNADFFMIAGSHTSSVLLSGLSYWLSITPRVYEKVTAEIRDAFSDSNQITFEACEKLPYLQAVISEGLRIFPPVPIAMNRQTTAPTMVCGQLLPAGVHLGVNHLVVAYSERNFHRANEFIPERWLEKDDPKSPFYNDKRDAFQPFSFGPRNCVGQALAGHEIRLICSKVFWNFDIKLEPECLGWEDQRVYGSWELPPLMIRFVDRLKAGKA